MANTIKKILREAILLKIAEYGNNISYFDNVICAPIWADDESGNKFYLFVGFNNIDNIKEFSYSFILLDKEIDFDTNPKKPLTKVTFIFIDSFNDPLDTVSYLVAPADIKERLLSLLNLLKNGNA